MSKVVKLGNAEVPLNRPKRRIFTHEFKLKFLAEADAATEAGQVAAMLRREGLYSSNLTEWRRARAAGQLGPAKPGQVNPLAVENKRLQKEKRALERKLKRAELLLEIQKKAAELMGIELDQQLPDDES